MNSIQYFKTLVLSRLLGGGNSRVIEAFRKEGMIIGEGTHIFSNIAASEPYLVSIGDHCCPEKFYHKVSCLAEPSSGTSMGASGLL